MPFHIFRRRKPKADLCHQPRYAAVDDDEERSVVAKMDIYDDGLVICTCRGPHASANARLIADALNEQGR